jgi:cyanophycinase
MTVATSLPGEVGSDYRDIFERLGVERVDIVDTERREDASDSRYIKVLKEATGVFFTGRDQARVTDVLKDTEMDHLLQEKFNFLP